MTLNSLKKFASDAAVVIEGYQQLVADQAAVINSLAKKASVKPEAATIKLSEELLKKASEAVHELYGRPVNVKPENIAQFWQGKPDAMLSTICKMANESAKKASISGETIGKQISKVASAKTKVDADADFWSKY